MRTTTLERAQVLQVKAGAVQPGDEVVYLFDDPSGVRSHVVTRAESVSFNEHRTWITLTGSELPRQLPVTHPVVVVRGLMLAT
ncbi:MAG: hypothetical protein ACRDYA_08235 [Egibacteraceae bacterium]